MTSFHTSEGHSQSIRFAHGLGPTQSIRCAHGASFCQALNIEIPGSKELGIFLFGI